MSRRDDPSDDLEEEEEDSGEEEKATPSRRRATSSRASRRPAYPPAPRPIRPWRSKAGVPEDDVAASRRELLEAKLNARRSSPTYWRFRDSFWFVPLIAVLILLLVIGGLVAYTSSWPPAYVVQSESMQHGPNDQLGLINTGDLVLSKKVSFDSITPYVVAMASRYTTYGEYGDVVLYEPNGGTATPIIHRAIVYLQYNANGTYSAPSLAGLPCGTAANAVYRVTSSPNGCGALGMSGELVLYHIGWRDATVNITLSPEDLGAHSGLVTMGDNNLSPQGCSTGCYGIADQADGASTLVEPGWVIGVARGMIPWIGAARLLIAGNAGEVPSQSWEFLGLSVVAIVLVGFAISYAWSSFRPVDPRRAAVREREDAVRREQEQTAEMEDGGSVRRWFHRRARDEDEEPEKTRSPRAVRGRPKPKVRRNGPSRPRRADAEDEDDEL